MAEVQEIFFATSNPGKVAEFQRLIPAVRQLKIDLPETQSLNPHEIIQQKLASAREHHDHGLLLVEDSSLELVALDGLPGPLVKWFEEAMGLERMADTVKKLGQTAATARTIIGLLNEAGQMHFFEGVVTGDFVPPRGDQDFGWGLSFQLKGETRTFGEMSRAEKDKFGMRAQALRQLISYLKGGDGSEP